MILDLVEIHHLQKLPFQFSQVVILLEILICISVQFLLIVEKLTSVAKETSEHRDLMTCQNSHIH